MTVIMNPPYNKNLHLKVLNETIKHCDNVVSLQPIRWLQDPLAEYKSNSDFKRFPEIRKHIQSVDVISALKSSDTFNITLSTDLGIYKLGKQGNNIDLRDPLAMKLFNKGAHYTSFDINKKDGWRVRFSLIDNCKAGGSSRNGVRFQRLLVFKDGMKDGKPWYEHFGRCGYSKETDYIPASLKFGSEKEANNFISVMSSKLGKYYWLSLQQAINVHPEFFLKLDWSKSWTDEELYDYFNLTDDEIKIIEEIIYEKTKTK